MSDIFPAVVYTLCFLTRAACAYLLMRSYAQTRLRLLLGSALCFFFLALNNLIVIFDMMLPEHNFSLLRVALSLIAVTLLLYGLIWEREENR